MAQSTMREFSLDVAHHTWPHSRMHGHTLYGEVAMSGPPDPRYGWTHDLAAVAAAMDEVVGQLHGRCLNDVPGLGVPTLENTAAWLLGRFSERIGGVERLRLWRGADGARESCVLLAADAAARAAAVTLAPLPDPEAPETDSAAWDRACAAVDRHAPAAAADAALAFMARARSRGASAPSETAADASGVSLTWERGGRSAAVLADCGGRIVGRIPRDGAADGRDVLAWVAEEFRLGGAGRAGIGPSPRD